MTLFNRIKNIVRSNISYKNQTFNNDVDLNDVEDLYFDDAKDEVKDDIEAKYYANLELPYGANFERIKIAYHEMLKKYHPDLYVNDKEKYKLAQKITRQINEAYSYFERKFS